MIITNRRLLFLIPVLGVSIIASFLIFKSTIFSSNAAAALSGGEPFSSVEVGIAEMSPNGESGGYAVPASGGSNPTCSIWLDSSTGTTRVWYSVSSPNSLSIINSTLTETGATTQALGISTGSQTNAGGYAVPVGAPDGAGQYTYTVDVDDLYYDCHFGPKGIECHSHTLSSSCSTVLTGAGSPSASVDVTATLEVCDDISTCANLSTSEGAAPASLDVDVESQNLTLRWVSADADACSLDFTANTSPNNSTGVSVTGPAIGSPAQPYTLNSCSDTASGDTTGSVTLNVTNVGPPVTSCGASYDISAQPKIIQKGDTSTLSWINSTTGAICEVTGDGNTYTAGPNSCSDTATRDVTPNTTTTYTLDCKDGTTPKTVTVQVVPSVDDN